jgi:acetyl-CoA C-acetyltransferase
MTSHGIRDKAAIIGMGCTRFTDHWERGLESLIVEAAHAALDEAGLTIKDVDAFWFGTAKSGASGLVLSQALKVDLKPVTRVENFCATGSEALRGAAYAVASGAYDVVLAVGAEKLKDSGYAGLLPLSPPDDGTLSSLTAPARFSFLAEAYAQRYGLSREKMKDVITRIAVKNHANGALNERAQFQKAVSEDVVRRSPAVAGLLGVFDCSGVSDGAAAAVLVRGERTAEYTQSAPMWVKGMSIAAGSATRLGDENWDLTYFPEVRASAADAYAQAGIDSPVDQLALAEVHDCFTPTELVLTEDLGFAKPGEGANLVLEGAFDRAGSMPVNPDGGLKAFGHPVGASGLRMIYECWLQLRGQAGARQIEGIGAGTGKSRALTQNLGGSPGECLSFAGVVGVERG